LKYSILERTNILFGIESLLNSLIYSCS